MMMSMLSSNHQELLLQNLMNDIIRADLAVLHRKKIANLVSFLFLFHASPPPVVLKLINVKCF